MVVVTDLDGTLLDAATYSFEAAIPAIRALEKKGIPLVFCSSKTRAEIEALRILVGNNDPFISENGGALYIPPDLFAFEIPAAKEKNGYRLLELGVPCRDLRALLLRLQAEHPGKIRGFGDMSDEEVAGLCGFSVEQARLAKKREYDEPFLCEDAEILSSLKQQARRAGLDLVRGGRFHHLIGPNDKGAAVRRLRGLYLKDRGPVTVIGLGDSLNDLPLLQESDLPVLIPRPDGTHESGIGLPGMLLAAKPGPEGWQEAVLSLIGSRTSPHF